MITLRDERIAELGVQASEQTDQATNAFDDSTGAWVNVWNEVYDQKFAALVMQEYVNQFQPTAPEGVEPVTVEELIDVNAKWVQQFGIESLIKQYAEYRVFTAAQSKKYKAMIESLTEAK